MIAGTVVSCGKPNLNDIISSDASQNSTDAQQNTTELPSQDSDKPQESEKAKTTKNPTLALIQRIKFSCFHIWKRSTINTVWN